MQPITLHSFDGGIHPQENKDQSTQSAIAQLPLPAQLVVPVGQHIGAPAEVIVGVGDLVLKGQLIAQAKGFVSAAIHAPTSGKVVAIEQRELPHSSGLEGTCVIIECDGQDQWLAEIADGSQAISDYLEADNDVLVNRIRDCGITGMGGAGFPTAVKMAVKGKQIDTLIINAAECEPYITADDMLMRERALEAMHGIQILMKLTSADNCLIGIEDNKPEAIKAMEDALHTVHGEHHIAVVTIPTKYPSGGEKQLIEILTGKEVPSGGIPAEVGIVCQNIGTCEAVYRAVAEGKPLVSRVTTITGESVEQPQNVEVLIGTPVKHLLEFAGFKQEKSLFQKLLGSFNSKTDDSQHNSAAKKPRLIMGGPMMGFTLSSDELPILKSSNCILAPSQQELPANDIASACIRCGLCTEACPADLLPQQLYWFSKAGELEKAEQHNIADCIECGACSYVCPSQIPLVQYYRHAKGAIKEERAAQDKSNRSKVRFEARQGRLDREAAEKEAKRQARAATAEKAQAAKKAAAAIALQQQAEDAAKNGDSAEGASPSITDAIAKPEAVDLEKLQQQLDAAQAGLKKSMDKIAEIKAAAEANANDDGSIEEPENLAVFEKAVASRRDKVKLLALQISDAKKSAPPVVKEVSRDDIEKKLRAQQDRIDKTQQRFQLAQEQGSETLPALQKGLDKQMQKLKELEAELAQFDKAGA
jgi:electron transport complex protein RnfC